MMMPLCVFSLSNMCFISVVKIIFSSLDYGLSLVRFIFILFSRFHFIEIRNSRKIYAMHSIAFLLRKCKVWKICRKRWFRLFEEFRERLDGETVRVWFGLWRLRFLMIVGSIELIFFFHKKLFLTSFEKFPW